MLFAVIPNSIIPLPAIFLLQDFHGPETQLMASVMLDLQGFNSIKETLLDTTTRPILVSSRYTLSAFGCSDTSSIVTVTVNSSPILKTQTFSICSGSAFVFPNDLMPSRTFYTWASPVVIPISSITGAKNVSNPLSVVSDTLINNGIHNRHCQLYHPASRRLVFHSTI